MDRDTRQSDVTITGALIADGGVCRKQKGNFPLQDNGFGQEHNSFITEFTLSGSGEIEGKYQSGHIQTTAGLEACQPGDLGLSCDNAGFLFFCFRNLMLLKLAVMRNGQIGSLQRRGQRLMAGLEFTANAPLPLWPHVSSLSPF